MRAAEINQPFILDGSQLSKNISGSIKDSGVAHLKESVDVKQAKPEYLKPRGSSFFYENGAQVGKSRASSFFEPSNNPNMMKDSSNLHESLKGNEENEEFFEAFEDLAEMLEAEKVIAQDIVKLNIARDLTSTNKMKSQTTFQLFTLKYIRWSFDINVENLSIEVGF